MSNIRISKITKEEAPKLPKGAKILRKEVNIEIRQIENGFITRKNFEYKYSVPGEKNGDLDTRWTNHSTEYFSEEDPMINDTENKPLADFFK